MYNFKGHISKFILLLICFVAIFAFVTDNVSAANTTTSGNGSNSTDISTHTPTNSLTSDDIKSSEVSDAQSSSSANISITNGYKNASSPGYPTPGNVTTKANYCNNIWADIHITNNGPSSANVTIYDNGSNGFVYYNPSIGWTGYVRFNNGTGWTWDQNFNVTTGYGTYNIPSGSTYEIAILGYINQTGTVDNTVSETNQSVYSPNPYPTVNATISVPAAAMIKLKNKFSTTLTGEPITNANYLDWVYSVITATNNGPNSANVVFQDTSIGFTPNGTYAVSTNNGTTWNYNDSSYNSTTGLWSIDIPSNATYLLAIYGQITSKGTANNTMTEISQDVYNPYGPDNSQPKVLIVFDDGNVADYTIAFPYMQSLGLLGTAYVNGYNIGNDGVLTVPELQTMNAAGWVIANHTYDHIDLVTVTDQEIYNEILNETNFLISNGLPNGAYDLAYPGGYTDQDVCNIMAELGITTGRTTNGFLIDNLNSQDMYQLPAYCLVNTTSVSTVEGYVNSAISSGSTAVILFHNLVSSNPGEFDYLTSDFQSIMSYIASTGINCLTINQLYQEAEVAPVNLPSNLTDFNESSSNGYASATALVTPEADIQVNNTASNYTPSEGSDVTLTVTVTNDGPDNAQDITMSEDVNQNDIKWISDDSGGAYDPTTGIWTIGTLDNGATAVLNIVAQIIASDTTIIDNVTYNSGSTFDPNPDNNNQTVTLVVPAASADIQVNNTASNYTPSNGSDVTLTVTVKNNGPSTAQNVTIQEGLNGNYLKYISDTSGGTYNSTTGLWTIGTLNSGATATLNITVQVTTATTIIDTATYTPTTTPDPNSTNNNQTVTLIVPASSADIQVNNTASNYTPSNGSDVTLTVTVKNNGPSTAQNVTIQEGLNGNYLKYISDTSGGTYNSTTGLWTIGTLNSGATATLNITAQVTTATTIIDTATYTPTTTPDPNSTNNNQTVTLIVPASSADIQVNNTASNYTPTNGSDVTLTVTVKNNGPSTAQNVTIQEGLNGNYLKYISDTSGGTYNSTTGLWTIGTLNSGATATLNITAQVTTATTIIDTATYTPTTTPDPNSTNNNQTVTLIVPASSADIQVNNTASNYTPTNGSDVTLTVTVKNNGPSTAQNVTIQEGLNGNYLKYISDTSGGTYNSTTGLWTIGTLNSGATATLNITAQVTTATTIIDTATYTPTTTPDPNSTNNNQTVTLVVPATQTDATNNLTVATTNVSNNQTSGINNTLQTNTSKNK